MKIAGFFYAKRGKNISIPMAKSSILIALRKIFIDFQVKCMHFMIRTCFFESKFFPSQVEYELVDRFFFHYKYFTFTLQFQTNLVRFGRNASKQTATDLLIFVPIVLVYVNILCSESCAMDGGS